MLALLLLSLLACPPQDGATAFQTGLESVRRLAEEERWTEAKDGLDRLLEEHRERDYVPRRLPELREEVTRIHFGLTYVPPDPRELISGQVAHYDPLTGQIRVRYRPGKNPARELRDFDASSGFYMHPLVFTGPRSITLRGPGFDRETWLVARETSTGTGPDKAMTAHIEPWGGDAALVFDQGSSYRRVMDHGVQKLLRSKKPYEIELSVDEGRIEVSGNRKPLLRAKGEPTTGQLGFVGGAPDEILIEGTASTAWIDGLIQEAADKSRSRFEADFDPLSELPEWLHAVDEVEATRVRFPYPNGERLVHGETWQRVAGLLAARRLAAARRLVPELDEEQTTEAFREFLSATIDAADYEYDDALAHAQRVLELEPGFSGARVLEARIRSDQGRRQEALALLERLTTDDPQDVHAWRERITTLLRAGRFDEAQASFARARDAGVSPAALEAVGSKLSRAVHGPDWDPAFRYDSRNYRVASNLSESICFEAAKILEEALQVYEEDSPWSSEPDEGRPLHRVFLFATRDEYRAYTGDLMGPGQELAGAVYAPGLKQLLILDDPDRRELYRTVRREVFHQYLDAMLPDAPTWLFTGLAEVYEDRPRKDLLGILFAPTTDWTALDRLPFMSTDEFEREADLHRAQSWGLAHFLLRSGPEERQRFDAYMAALTEQAPWLEAGAMLLDGRDAQELRRSVRAHLVKQRSSAR